MSDGNQFLMLLLGSGLTLLGGYIAHKRELSSQAKESLKEKKSLLLSLDSEAGVLWELYSHEVGNDLTKLNPGDMYMSYYPLSQNYFVIYDRNAAQIGSLDNENLQRAIIAFYCRAKGIVDDHQFHNRVLDEHTRLSYLARISPTPDILEALNNNETMIKNNTQGLVSLCNEVGQRLVDMKREIRREVKSIDEKLGIVKLHY